MKSNRQIFNVFLGLLTACITSGEVFAASCEKKFHDVSNLIISGPETELPSGKTVAPESIPHFPDRQHAFVWRNCNLVSVEKLAQVLRTSVPDIKKMGAAMGLPVYREPKWTVQQIYITLIRRNWHLLPYEQLMQLVDMTAEQLNKSLREDDFLWVKLGMVKPQCDPLYYTQPAPEVLHRLKEIRRIVKGYSHPVPAKEEDRFAFIKEIQAVRTVKPAESYRHSDNEKPRFIYSYFALYGDPLVSTGDIFPGGLLEKLSARGVNGIWLHVLLRDLAPGGEAFPEFGENHEIRIRNLRRAAEKAKQYGMKIYLYLNEPRAMPLSFFEAQHVPGRALTKGVREGDYAALCTSNRDVQNWLRDALTYVFTEIPALGGVFTISGSENLTYCNSHGNWQQCPHCRDRSGSRVIAEANTLIAEGVHRASPDAKVMIWDWGWNGHGIATDVIEKLPNDVWLMSVSEWALPISRGGIESRVGEYSLSAVGPGPRAKEHWRAAKQRGLKTVAKVQVNCTWEIASVPYVPVMDLIAEHFSNLDSLGVDGFLMSWTLGGYPSPNLMIPGLFDRCPVPSKDEVLQELAVKRYGPNGSADARRAWTLMSEAYREYPYSGSVVYYAPVQMGPANLFRAQPAGYSATMTGLPYDDLDNWRSIYPAEVFISQFEKVAKGFDKAIPLLQRASRAKDVPDPADVKADLRYAQVVRIHFASVANQSRYILLRRQLGEPGLDAGRKEQLTNEMRKVIEEEIRLTEELYPLVLEDSRVGFEAANQYFYVPNDLLEKIISCRQLLEELK